MANTRIPLTILSLASAYGLAQTVHTGQAGSKSVATISSKVTGGASRSQWHWQNPLPHEKSDSNAHSDTDGYSYSEPKCYSNRNSYGHTDADCNTHFDAYSYCDPDGYSNIHGDSNTNSYAQFHANPHRDAYPECHTQTYSSTQTSPDATTSPYTASGVRCVNPSDGRFLIVD